MAKKNQTLLQKAQKFGIGPRPRKFSSSEKQEEALELFLAYFKNEITSAQVGSALGMMQPKGRGLNLGHYGWRVLRDAYKREEIEIRRK